MENKTVLLSARIKITKIVKKTSAKGFSDLKAGDVLEVTFELNHKRSYRGIYATSVCIEVNNGGAEHMFYSLTSTFERMFQQNFEWIYVS